MSLLENPLLLKESNAYSLSNGRAIACLLTFYEIVSAIISDKVYAHCENKYHHKRTDRPLGSSISIIDSRGSPDS